MPLALANADAGYEDAGVVTDIGPVWGFNGITDTGTGPLAANIWISNGGEAFSPGFHLFSAGSGTSTTTRSRVTARTRRWVARLLRSRVT